MKYTKEDIRQLKSRGMKSETIDAQLADFQKGFTPVTLTEPATVGNGILQITAEEGDRLVALYEQAAPHTDILKMVPASGSATRMFKELFAFADSYKGSVEEFLQLVQQKQPGSMHDFFLKLDELPFYTRLSDIIWKDGKDIVKMIEKREFNDLLKYILTKKGLNYGNTPKALIDFHIYRDFVRTAFDEHLVEGALYAGDGKKAQIHFTISEEYLPLFQARLRKVTKVFEKMFGVKYEVTFSFQKSSTDRVSVDMDGNLLRDEKGEILFHPGGHGALIYNLDELKADLIFIKNIDNVTPDRTKGDTVKYKKILAGILLETRRKIADYLALLDKKPTEEQLREIENFLPSVGYREMPATAHKDTKERIRRLRDILDRPLRVCGMVKNEGEPGGSPFWVKTPDGASRLMIIESAQIDRENKEQVQCFNSSTHFNPVDIVCCTKNRKGKKYDLREYIAAEQAFITRKSYKGKDILARELPGLWNGAMANWNTLFVEVPLTTFTPVKTVFDLFRFEHRNVLKRL